MSTNKEAKISHWHTNCHHYAQHTPQTCPLSLQVDSQMLRLKRGCRIAGPGATVSLCREGRTKEQPQQNCEMVEYELPISRDNT